MSDEPKFNPGDKVVVLHYGPSWEGEGTVVAPTDSMGITIIDVDRSGRRGGFYFSDGDFVLKSVYNSPLWKALK